MTQLILMEAVMRSLVSTLTFHPVSWTWPRLSLAGVVAHLVRMDAAYRQRRQLQRLDDRMLQDIGITRADVEREMRAPLRW